MLTNYLRLAFRNLRRNKLYSLVNIGCLAIGIAVAMTISLYVLHEHSYDRWHANARRIFSVSVSQRYGGSDFLYNQLSYITGPMVQLTDPSVEAMVRTRRPSKGSTCRTLPSRKRIFGKPTISSMPTAISSASSVSVCCKAGLPGCWTGHLPLC